MNYIIKILIRYYIIIANFTLALLQKLLYKNIRSGKPSNILIYRIGNIGDIICAIPAISQIRYKYPDAKITLLSNAGGFTSAANILCNIEWLDEIRMYDSSQFSSLRKIKFFIHSLKKNNYDTLINLPNVASNYSNQLRNLVFFKIVGIPYAGNFYIHNLRAMPKLQIDYIDKENETMRLLKNLPFDHSNEVHYNYLFTDKIMQKVNQKIADLCIDHDEKVLVISFSCKGDAKKWPINRFVEIIIRWIDYYQGTVLLIGAREDHNLGEEIVNLVNKNKCYNLCGAFSIQESIYLLSKVSMLVGLDTGTAHMASIVGCKSITLFSAFDFPCIWYPWGKNSKIIRKDMDCSPCLSKDCKFGTPSRCMQSITVEEVWDLINDTIDKDKYNYEKNYSKTL